MYTMYYYMEVDGKDVDMSTEVCNIRHAFREFQQIERDHPGQRISFNKIIPMQTIKDDEPVIAYIEARDMLEEERPYPYAGKVIKDLARTIIQGGYLSLSRGIGWDVVSVSNKGENYIVIHFHERNKAIRFIGNVYIYALDNIGMPR